MSDEAQYAPEPMQQDQRDQAHAAQVAATHARSRTTAAEILRHCLAEKVDATKLDDGPAWVRVREGIEKMSHENPIITKLGLSGAQWGAAMNLAMMLYRKGPRAVMTDERVKDRHIQVSKNFPEG